MWDSSQVRDLLDSLYKGYPVGYLIAWKNPDVKLKNGELSPGKRILIDGQQRVTALMTALLGNIVIDKNYQRSKIKIAFHPMEERFEVLNSAIEKDKYWLQDVASVLRPGFKVFKWVSDYCQKNGIEDTDLVHTRIDNLRSIVNNHIGLIELHSELDIETVTEIFIRINSKGTVLSQADFAMSKIAANEEYGGNILRKVIDYFCHLAVNPEYYHIIFDNDEEFAKTPHMNKISWLKNENDDLYDPSYTDLLRVSFTSEFKRGRLRDLVALLSGRNFKTKKYEAEIAERSFQQLYKGVEKFINETNFKRFLMIIRSAGFVDSALIGSQNAVNFAYVLYLYLREKGYPAHEIERYVISILTDRYTGNPDGAFDLDIRRIKEIGFENYIKGVEDAELSDALWDFGLPQRLNVSVSTSPFYKLYIAAQVKFKRCRIFI